MIRKRHCLMLEPGPMGEVRFVNWLLPSCCLIGRKRRCKLRRRVLMQRSPYERITRSRRLVQGSLASWPIAADTLS
jgi:hypothetical protein